MVEEGQKKVDREGGLRVLKTLTYREREILMLRYGIGDGYIYTLEEVGTIFKVTRERIRQVQAKAIRKLGHPVRLAMIHALEHKDVKGYLAAMRMELPDEST